ncbi:hypothetical protein V6N13_088989 [Hibiscus sabdariffa]
MKNGSLVGLGRSMHLDSLLELRQRVTVGASYFNANDVGDDGASVGSRGFLRLRIAILLVQVQPQIGARDYAVCGTVGDEGVGLEDATATMESSPKDGDFVELTIFFLHFLREVATGLPLLWYASNNMLMRFNNSKGKCKRWWSAINSTRKAWNVMLETGSSS